MFRTDSDDSNYRFGAGSTIEAGPFQKFLVIATGDSRITLVDLVTMKIHEKDIAVVDPYHLTEKETRMLIDVNFPRYTFSDFDFNPKGLK